MEQIINYVKPELLIVAVMLYFVGCFLKKAEAVSDKYIPFILGGTGIVVCGLYAAATVSDATAQDILMAIFTAIVQGILVAGLAVYANQCKKQIGKDE